MGMQVKYFLLKIDEALKLDKVVRHDFLPRSKLSCCPILVPKGSLCRFKP